MRGDTREGLITAASRLLDAGGQDAVTLRAVAKAAGVSHNAPYHYFASRSALLAAVAESDLRDVAEVLLAKASGDADPRTTLKAAAAFLARAARKHPARYRLMFSDPALMPPSETLEQAAMAAFQAFGTLVSRYQAECGEVHVETAKLTGLIYAALHGQIDLELGGRAKGANGLNDPSAMMDLLLGLIAR